MNPCSSSTSFVSACTVPQEPKAFSKLWILLWDEEANYELEFIINSFSEEARLETAKKILERDVEALCKHIHKLKLLPEQCVELAMQISIDRPDLLARYIANFHIQDSGIRLQLARNVFLNPIFSEDIYLYIKNFRLIENKVYSFNLIVDFSRPVPQSTLGVQLLKERIENARPGELVGIVDAGPDRDESESIVRAFVFVDGNSRVYIGDHGRPYLESIDSGDYKMVGDYLAKHIRPFSSGVLRISLNTCCSARGYEHGAKSFAGLLHSYLESIGIRSEVCARVTALYSPLRPGMGKRTESAWIHRKVYQAPGSKLTFKVNSLGQRIVVDSYIDKAVRHSRNLLGIIVFELHSVQGVELHGKLQAIDRVCKKEDISQVEAVELIRHWKHCLKLIPVEAVLCRALIKSFIEDHDPSIGRSSVSPKILGTTGSHSHETARECAHRIYALTQEALLAEPDVRLRPLMQALSNTINKWCDQVPPYPLGEQHEEHHQILKNVILQLVGIVCSESSTEIKRYQITAFLALIERDLHRRKYRHGLLGALEKKNVRGYQEALCGAEWQNAWSEHFLFDLKKDVIFYLTNIPSIAVEDSFFSVGIVPGAVIPPGMIEDCESR